MGKEIPSDTADYFLSGRYIPNEIFQPNYGEFFQVGDINGDNIDDLLISSAINTLPLNPKDSLDVLQIYYGQENFTAIQGQESEKYTSIVNPDDSTAGWFIRVFSVDDINGDGIDDIVVGRSSYNFPHQSTVHYGSNNGIDTIPSFTFIQDTTTDMFFSAGGITQNIGDFNNDNFDDIIMYPSGYQIFTLHLCGPYVNNKNRYGAKGFSNGSSVIPQKAVNMGDQNNDGIKDVAFTTMTGYALMFYGLNIPTGVDEVIRVPGAFNLLQNYPNPFNPSTIISWKLNKISFITLKIYDSLGSEITTLVNEERETGNHQIEFDASKLKLSSGVYFCKLIIRGGESSTIKMIYMK
jgi:hypothetical protein